MLSRPLQKSPTTTHPCPLWAPPHTPHLLYLCSWHCLPRHHLCRLPLLGPHIPLHLSMNQCSGHPSFVCILPSDTCTLVLPNYSVGRDTGDPRVFFCQPIPTPANTVPIRVGVWLPPWVLQVTHDVRRWQEPPCPPTAPASKKSHNCRLLRVQELRMGFLAPSSSAPTNHLWAGEQNWYRRGWKRISKASLRRTWNIISNLKIATACIKINMPTLKLYQSSIKNLLQHDA